MNPEVRPEGDLGEEPEPLADTAETVAELDAKISGDNPPNEPVRDDTVAPPPSADPPAADLAPAAREWEEGVDRCPECGEPISLQELYCENCGAEINLPDLPKDEPASRTCVECGGAVADDGYCEQCGAKAPSARDHFTMQPAPWIAATCDRGIRHSRNEDAVAAWAEPDSFGDGADRGVLVVCDGVSTATDSDVASLAASNAAVRVLATDDPLTGMTLAARTANSAVISTIQDPKSPPSCTFAAAVVADMHLTYGNIGDSRVYWIPDVSPPVLLSTDDSVAQARIAMGVEREVAENSPQAHAITRWLGPDAPDLEPTVGQLRLAEPGWVLVCSDGLWNYASAPAKLAELIRVAITNNPENSDPLILSASMVRWANTQGGRDNITVALARIDGPGAYQLEEA